MTREKTLCVSPIEVDSAIPVPSGTVRPVVLLPQVDLNSSNSSDCECRLLRPRQAGFHVCLQRFWCCGIAASTSNPVSASVASAVLLGAFPHVTLKCTYPAHSSGRLCMWVHAANVRRGVEGTTLQMS